MKAICMELCEAGLFGLMLGAGFALGFGASMFALVCAAKLVGVWNLLGM